MKKKTIALFFCAAAVILMAAVAIRPVIKGFIASALRKTFIGSSVSIGGYSLNPFNSLELYAVKISNGQAYNFSIGKIKVRYSLLSLAGKKIDSITVEDIEAGISIARPDKFDLEHYLRLEKKSAFVLRRVGLSAGRLKLNFGELSLEARAAFDLDPETGILNSVLLEIPALNSGQFKLADFVLEAGQDAAQGKLAARAMGYGKINCGNVRAEAALSGKKLSLSRLSMDVLGGTIEGNVVCILTAPLAYAAKFKASGINMAKLIIDLDLAERLKIEGAVSGALEVEGSGLDLSRLEGNFNSDGSGGRLTITDERILEAMAKNTGQTLSFMVESFRDYRYNTARAVLGIKDSDIIFNVAMDSEAGKREFVLVWHDFQIR